MEIKNKQLLNISYLPILCLFFWMFVQYASSIKNTSSIGVKERHGLNNSLFKMKSRDTVRVAYLGGSITAQPGWRVYSLNWFKENYPNTKFVEINAAIGGTGSPFGVYRLKDQVLQYNPDLVFIEFAVNDASTNPEEITRSMEGIVRQI